MIIDKELTIRPESIAKSGAPIFPNSSAEFVNSISHYYRGEMSRMMSWRDRLDRTTNWAITGVGAMLSVSLSSPQSHHGVLLFAMLLVFLLLQIESRRYRFFHVYRTRVRLIERNYYARIFAPGDAVDPVHWMSQLGDDLRLPRFSMSRGEAIARRLRRNYIWLFLIILLAWLLKTSTVVAQPGDLQGQIVHSTGELFHNAAIGHIPGWMVSAAVLLFYGWLFYLILSHRKMTGELAYGEVHV
jgi:uncharacterized membrane protein